MQYEGESLPEASFSCCIIQAIANGIDYEAARMQCCIENQIEMEGYSLRCAREYCHFNILEDRVFEMNYEVHKSINKLLHFLLECPVYSTAIRGCNAGG